MANEEDILRVETRDCASHHVEVWTLNRPLFLNALNMAVLKRVRSEADRLKDELRSSYSKRGLILIGSGEKAFVAGADIAEMKDLDSAAAEKFSREGQEAFAALGEIPVPVIAAVRGFALGGGLELAMGCDLIVATAKSEFGQPEAHLGLIPGFGATARFTAKLGLSKSLELLYSGARIKAEEALRLGLIQRVTENEEILPFALEVMGEFIKKSSPGALAEIKRLCRLGQKKIIETVCEEEAKAFGRIFATADKKEGVAAFLEKRKAKFSGN